MHNTEMPPKTGESRPRALNQATDVQYDFGGVIREYLDAITQNWLLKMSGANPGVLDVFRTRDQKPYRSLLPWSGEYAGKYLTGAVQVYRLTGDPSLKQHLAGFVLEMTGLQDDEGYLGPFPQENRLQPGLPPVESRTYEGFDWANWKSNPWDAWGHYHAMLGLLLWHETTGDLGALRCATRIGDLFTAKFLHTGKRVVDISDVGAGEMNHAVIHSLCLLFRATGTKACLELAREIADNELPDEKAGDFMRIALAGKEFYQGPKPRWESLHSIQGLAELYWLTGDEKYREAFSQIWWSIVKLDRHNNGGFSSGEQAGGNPYDQAGIETCCTVAWVALSVDMLRLTGNSIVADELELSTLNQVMGYQDRSGKWCTYDTPMDGARVDSIRRLMFQSRPGSEGVNCCNANAPRGFGMVSDWALMAGEGDLVVNWYGPCTMTARVKDVEVSLVQTTDYPRGGRIKLTLSPEKEVSFSLKLRIPHWSARTVVQINGEPIPSVPAGKYLMLDRAWVAGDTVQIDLDMSLHYWVGEKQLEGRTSIYRGPVLLAYESPACAPRFSPGWFGVTEEWSAKQPGVYFEYDFEGPAVVWKGHLGDDAGLVSVCVDGREIAVVDQYGADRNLPFVWEYKNSEPGRHTIKVTLLDQKNPASTGHWVNLSSFGIPETPEPAFDATRMDEHLVGDDGKSHSLVMLDVKTTGNAKVTLRDYGTAGEDNIPYVSWHKVANISPAAFSFANPLRSSRQVNTR